MTSPDRPAPLFLAGRNVKPITVFAVSVPQTFCQSAAGNTAKGTTRRGVALTLARLAHGSFGTRHELRQGRLVDVKVDESTFSVATTAAQKATISSSVVTP